MGLLGAWMIIHWVLTRLGPRLVVWAAAGVLVAAVGASRLYLGVHYPSDVLAGWLLGAGWAVTVAVAVSLWEDHAAAPTAATTAPDRPWPRIALRSPVPDRGVSAVPADQPLPASCPRKNQAADAIPPDARVGRSPRRRSSTYSARLGTRTGDQPTRDRSGRRPRDLGHLLRLGALARASPGGDDQAVLGEQALALAGLPDAAARRFHRPGRCHPHYLFTRWCRFGLVWVVGTPRDSARLGAPVMMSQGRRSCG